MNDLIHILVVGDQTVERKGLSSILNNVPSLVVVGEAASGQEAVLMVRESHPNIILIDYKLLDKEGLDSIGHIWHQNADIAVLVLGNSAEKAPAAMNFAAGRMSFTDKDAAPEELTRVIREMTHN